MSVGPVVKTSAFLLAAFAIMLAAGQASAQTTLEIGIGIQNTTTNTCLKNTCLPPASTRISNIRCPGRTPRPGRRSLTV
jgi:hypothetical protein